MAGTEPTLRLAAGMTERARRVYDRDAGPYAGVELHPVERRLLAEIGTRWASTRMLDLGIGSGRTTLTFGAICGEYVGTDFSEEMVRRARERAVLVPRARIMHGDARAMPEFADGSFDVVLFSFNGIDSIDPEGREAVMREVRRVLRPGGLFVFSSHTLAKPQSRLRLMRWRSPAWSARVLLGAIRDRILFRWVNGPVDYAALAARGFAVFVEAHRFTLALYHVTPRESARQIAAAGLELVEVLAMDATPLREPYASLDPWVFYWCRRPV